MDIIGSSRVRSDFEQSSNLVRGWICAPLLEMALVKKIDEHALQHPLTLVVGPLSSTRGRWELRERRHAVIPIGNGT